MLPFKNNMGIVKKWKPETTKLVSVKHNLAEGFSTSENLRRRLYVIKIRHFIVQSSDP